MTEQHSPTPWRRLGQMGVSSRRTVANLHAITTEPNSLIPNVYVWAPEDADFIIRSVNSHDRLVVALHSLISVVERSPLYKREGYDAEDVRVYLNEGLAALAAAGEEVEAT